MAGRIRWAIQAVRDAFTAAPDATYSGVQVTSPRSSGDVTPHRTSNRDRAMEYTTAPPGARQQWQLHRVREESRDLALRSPIWGGYVRFVRIQALGSELSRLQFDRVERADKARLHAVTKRIRSEWNRYQKIRGIGGTGQTIHQLAGSVLHHVIVDGDCFLLSRGMGAARKWDLHPGDALAESSYNIGIGTQENSQLGVVTDPWGMPIAYAFGTGAKLNRLNWGYLSYASTSEVKRIPAAQVRHIRDRSGEVTAVRGWPRCTTVTEDIARLDEWYAALSRSAVLRAAIGLLLEKDQGLGSPASLDGGFGPSQVAQSLDRQYGTGGAPEATGGERKRPYHEFAEKAGSVTELEPGWKPHAVPAIAPTAQEAEAIKMLERRVCGALRVTPATLLGDYKAVSYSGGQLGHMQERQSIEDFQMMLTDQVYGPVYERFLADRWMRLMSEFHELKPDDMQALLYPNIMLRRYQVLEKGKIIKPLLEAWNSGAITYPELRAELGFLGANIDEVMEEWKENRIAMGLPDVPSQGMAGKMPGDGSEKDAGDDSDDEDDAEDDDDDA